jgi:hypothetical protein
MSGMGTSPKNDEQDNFTDAEVARRRDAALLKALSTPHKKQTDMKLGKKRTPKSDDKANRKKRGRRPELKDGSQ